MTGSRGRLLFGAPLLLQDWDQEAQHAFQYWELFLDLILVASASTVTDQFKNHANLVGFGEFVLFSLSLLNGWILYTHHITSRFQDASLLHSMVLFLYCVGLGLANVNTGYETAQQFCWGAVLLRLAILLMLVHFAISIERSRYFCAALGVLVATSLVAYGIVAVFGDEIQGKQSIMVIFFLAVGLELFGEVFMALCLEGRRLVPVNIEQTKERLGAMELIALGETVLSVTIIYRESAGEHDESSGEEGEETLDDEWNAESRFYRLLGYSFLLIFMFLLLYFHMQPESSDHALRRSRYHGVALMILHKFMAVAFLVVGVSVKMVVESLLQDQSIQPVASVLMGCGVGTSLLTLFAMRYLHYGGQDSINFGHLVLHYGVDSHLDRVAMIWWMTVGAAGFLPIAGVLTGWTLSLDPLGLIRLHAVIVFAICGVETYYSHKIQAYLEKDEASERERETLIGATGDKSYS